MIWLIYFGTLFFLIRTGLWEILLWAGVIAWIGHMHG